MTGPGTPSRSPMAMIFFPFCIRPPLNIVTIYQKRTTVRQLRHAAEKQTAFRDQQGSANLARTQIFHRVA